MPDAALPDQPVVFRVIEKGSKRGGKLLVSSDGHSYGIKVKHLINLLFNIAQKKARYLQTIHTCVSRHTIVMQ